MNTQEQWAPKPNNAHSEVKAHDGGRQICRAVFDESVIESACVSTRKQTTEAW